MVVLEKKLNNILIYGCSPIQGKISNFTLFMCMFLSKTVSKNLSKLVNRAPINKCKKEEVYFTCKKGNQDVRVSEKEI